MEFRSPVKILIISSLLLVLALAGGCTFFTGDGSSNHGPDSMDAQCEMQEINLTIIHNLTIVPVTEEDVRLYPEFGMYMQNKTGILPEGYSGWRVVRNFDCNESRARNFLTLYRKFEENPNQPVIEYHGRYYRMSYASFWGTTARPTILVPAQARQDSPS
jgi:hypothetical protein